ncbi:hypothetical protein N431DRAFT_455826 [Stipitochalara longipes BDJ]|nr:hypothetical protein N431DRAFT_455826 [Stipitochalara longipes BDJ]
MEKAQKDGEGENVKSRQPWDIAHGFYLVMGGFVLETPGSFPGVLPESRTTLTLSTKDIFAKSKGNGLAKSLVCLRAVWFCIQCVLRVSQDLPITLLKVNTMAHSVCALLVYVPWWQKPLDVEQPYCIPICDQAAMVAWAWVNSGNSFEYLKSSRKSPFSAVSTTLRSWFRPEYSKRVRYLERFEPSQNKERGLNEPPESRWDVVSSESIVCPGNLVTLAQIEGSNDDPDGAWWPISGRNTTRLVPRLEKVTYTTTDAKTRHWHLQNTLDDRCLHLSSSGVTRAVNRPSFDIKKPVSLVLFSLIAFLYGGAHCLAWNSGFPSQVEKSLWRSSSVVVMGGKYTYACMLCIVGAGGSRQYYLCCPAEVGVVDPGIIWDELPILYNTIDYLLKVILVGTLAASSILPAQLVDILPAYWVIANKKMIRKARRWVWVLDYTYRCQH